MKKVHITLTGLVFAILSFGCQNQSQAPTQSEKTVLPTSETRAVASEVSATGPIEPPQGWPSNLNGQWKFNPDREDPVKCRFTVKVEGLKSDQARLIGVYGEQNYPAGEATIESDGTAVFQKEGGYLSGFYYVLFGDNTAVTLVLNKDQEFSVQIGNKTDINGSIQIEGSQDNTLFYEMNRFENSLNPEITTLGQQMQGKQPSDPTWQTASKAQKKLLQSKIDKLRAWRKQYPDAFYPVFKLAGQNPNPDPILAADGTMDNAAFASRYRQQFWKDVDFGDVRLLRTPVLHNKLKRYIQDLTPQNIDSVIKSIDIVSRKAVAHPEVYKHIVNWIGTTYKENSIMGGQAIFLHVIDNYFTDELAYWDTPAGLEKIRDKVDEMRYSLLGMQGQNVTANDVDGVSRSLYDLPGEILVVFMYSPNCDHCREAAPEMVEIYNKWHKKGLDIYGICTETELEPLQKFVKKYNFPWWNVIDPTYKSFYMKYHVDITPEIYVLDKDRTIIAKDLKPFQLEEVLTKQLGE